MSAPSETAAAQGSHNTLYSKSMYWDGTKYVSNTASGYGAQSGGGANAMGSVSKPLDRPANS